MTVRISPYKASKIIHLFFKGIPQPEIGKKCSVNQATVSRYVLRLKNEVDRNGFMAAAKEYGVMHEIDSLRSLAIELSQNGLTAEEAGEGVSILKLFNKLGVSASEHESLIKVISKLEDPNFVPAAVKLVKLEAGTGKTYTEVVTQFEQLASEVVKQEKRCAALKKEGEGLRQAAKRLATEKEHKEQ